MSKVLQQASHAATFRKVNQLHKLPTGK